MTHFHVDPLLATSHAAVIFVAAAASYAVGLDPGVAQAINSVAILGVACITAWTAAKAAQIKKVADATHALSNSAMGVQLLANVQNLEALSVLAHRFAENNNAADIAAAVAIDVRVESAKTVYQEHLKQQAVVDAIAR